VATSVTVRSANAEASGSRVARALLRAAGWRVEFAGGELPALQGVLIVYPHTSNWDFVVGLLAKWSLGLQLAFWGKASLFRLPLFGSWLRHLGGLPVERDNPQGAVGAMVDRFVAARRDGAYLWLALAPEGTRARREHWRSGFYRVALQAGVPLGLAYIDYAQRRVGIHSFLRLSGDEAADMGAIAECIGQRVGKHPALAAPVRLP
jgi:1-acyl-sn-glycerol-3-phosphate acyltransferase